MSDAGPWNTSSATAAPNELIGVCLLPIRLSVDIQCEPGSDMISRYVDAALRKARYAIIDGGTFCATVPGLRGVIATGRTLEGCRDDLAEVVEGWVLVRVARGLTVPRLGGLTVEVRKAG